MFQAPEGGGEQGGGGGEADSAAQPATSAAAAAAAAAVAAAAGAAGQAQSGKEQPKRLHISNIPFRFRDPDLRAMFGVRLRGTLCSGSGSEVISG